MMPIRVHISQHSSLVLKPRAAQEWGRGPEEGASRRARDIKTGLPHRAAVASCVDWIFPVSPLLG